MKRKKIIPALFLCVILFAAALFLSVIIDREGRPAGPEGQENAQVVLNEILPGNRTYPGPQGGYPDFIELKNSSASSVDISGYMVTDRQDSAGYTFPQGTVIPAGGCITVWCEADSQVYAGFGISRNGGDTVYLYNGANVLIGQQTVPLTPANFSLIRQEDGTWGSTARVTPGYDNTDEGYEKWLQSVGADSVRIFISEVSSASGMVAPDGVTACDWIELYNPGQEPVVLDGAYLSDDPMDPLKWQIESLTVAPGGYAVIRCTGQAGTQDAPFALSRSGCTVTLSSPVGNVLAQVQVPQLAKDHSWAMQEGDYSEAEEMTPGFENTHAGYEAWLQSVGAGSCPVIITELMASNRSTVISQNGVLCDWVELHNPTENDVVLEGAYLSDDPEKRDKWPIPRLELSAGARVVIPCVGAKAGEGEADFALASSGGEVLLTLSTGLVGCRVEYPTLEPDWVYALQTDGSFRVTQLASPGYLNTEAGAEAFRAGREPLDGLIISEVMSANSQYLMQSDGQYHDWVELRNISEESIDLSGFCLASDPDERTRFVLPQKILEPGEYVIVICSGNTQLSGNYIQAPFTLSREECWVYLSRTDGTLSDMLHVVGVPTGCSAGRSDGDFGTYYFADPTPAAPNGAGVAFVSRDPVAVTRDGAYNGVDGLQVEFSGASMHYTTDGSVPTANSKLYTGPIQLTETTVIRIASFEEGKLPSRVVSATYFLNENHTLPILSLSAKPGSLFGASGIYVKYWRDVEIEANLTLYEGDGGFSIDCGLEMFGHTALELDKKGFKVNFRGRYGQDFLGYPVFGPEGPQIFDALCIRAGQDYPQATFRDELFTSLCMEFSQDALAQRHKFCILYINGEYWGIYALKESFGETYYAQNRGVSAESVEVIQAPLEWGTELYKLIRYGKENDLADPEHYEYLSSMIDMDSLADWMVMQGYSGNNDIEQNLRYFRSTSNGNRLQLAFYDQDWAFYYHQELDNLFSPERTKQYLNLTKTVVENPQFREKLLQRFSDAYHGVLSDEHVHAKIDEFVELLTPEVDRDRRKWSSSFQAFEYNVNYLREFIDEDHWEKIISKLRYYLDMTKEEETRYFGG